MKRSLVVYGTRPEFLKVQTLLALDRSIDSLFIQQHTDIIDFGLPTHKISILNTCSNRLNSIFCEIFIPHLEPQIQVLIWGQIPRKVKAVE